jgi:hypothetical protein
MSYIVACIAEATVLTAVGPFATQAQAEHWRARKNVPPLSDCTQMLVLPLVAARQQTAASGEEGE